MLLTIKNRVTNKIFIFQDGRRFFKMVPKTHLIVYTILADDQLELTFCDYLLTRTDKCLGTMNIPQSKHNFDYFYSAHAQAFSQIDFCFD